MSFDLARRHFLSLPAAAVLMRFLDVTPAVSASEVGRWISLFDGSSRKDWKAVGDADAWRVEGGCLVADRSHGHLFYDGPVAQREFGNFELKAEVRSSAGADSGICLHTVVPPTGEPSLGPQAQIGNATGDADRPRPATGSLYGTRNIYASAVREGEWFRIRVRMIGRRICIWVNDYPTVDYLANDDAASDRRRSGTVRSRGTIALEGPGESGRVAFRRIAVRRLPDDADPSKPERASEEGYGIERSAMDRLAAAGIPLVDFHVHLRGGMTVEKAMDRQAVTGINIGVLKNIGEGWPIETDQQLREFLDSVQKRPVFVGLQVNDRDWHTKHSSALLSRLDFVLGDTMIMPMPHDDSPPVKLWIADQYTIDDAEAWMERYVRHNLRVLAEPITILANPTYLPPAVEDKYEDLWTDERMRTIIRAAVDNDVALEINARSGLPSDRFLHLAKQLGAKFTFGSNNFEDNAIDMTRCLEAIERFELKASDLYLPVG